MKKYLKRWKKLPMKHKVAFFNTYMDTGNMCNRCISLDTDIKNCNCCAIMFPEGKVNNDVFCPCHVYQANGIKDQPPTVIEYCLIKDGWIEKE